MDSDKRTFPRFSFAEPVAYGSSEESFNGSVAGNISLGGISLKVQDFVPMGTILELQLSLGRSSEIIWAKAQVVRIREISEGSYEVGLRFIKDEECIRAIGKYIHAHRSE